MAAQEPEQSDELEDHQEGAKNSWKTRYAPMSDERPHDVPVREDDEDPQERDHADDEQRPDQRPDTAKGAIDLVVELVGLRLASGIFERLS